MEKEKKKNRYLRIYSQLEKLYERTLDPFARISTAIAILHHKFDYFFWTGFYRLVEGELIVTAYQGSLACLVLKKNTGVCWAGINEKKIIIVKDIHTFAGHISCDSRSNSEIVIPIYNKENKIIGVFDVDSKDKNSFDKIDAKCLKKIIRMIYHS